MDICKHNKIDFEFKKVNDDDSANNISNTITCSCQLLDTIIENATNNKKTLDSTMDDIIRLMKEVECTEKAAEQAKEEAATSSLHTLSKVEELKQARQLAKETNDTHAKEVYAQKVVLDTKVKELKFRASGLVNQGGTSLGVLDEMRRALEKRMALALREKELADKEKIENECLSQKALADEENQLKKVKEMSERLKEEEVKNSKLQQFLVDRSHVIDMLDEDISDKIKDVNLLKKSLDQVVSFSEVLSSTQISSIVSERSSLTKETSNEINEPAGSNMVLDNIFTFQNHRLTEEKELLEREHQVEVELSRARHYGDVREKYRLTRLIQDKMDFEERVTRRRQADYDRMKYEREQRLKERKKEREIKRKMLYFIKKTKEERLNRLCQEVERRKKEEAERRAMLDEIAEGRKKRVYELTELFNDC